MSLSWKQEKATGENANAGLPIPSGRSRRHFRTPGGTTQTVSACCLSAVKQAALQHAAAHGPPLLNRPRPCTAPCSRAAATMPDRTALRHRDPAAARVGRTPGEYLAQPARTGPGNDSEITKAGTRPMAADVVQRYVVWDRDERVQPAHLRRRLILPPARRALPGRRTACTRAREPGTACGSSRPSGAAADGTSSRRGRNCTTDTTCLPQQDDALSTSREGCSGRDVSRRRASAPYSQMCSLSASRRGIRRRAVP